jgi:hypothetical protein
MFEKVWSTKNIKKAVKIFDEKVNWPSLRVDFTSIFWWLDWFLFALLGSAFVKALFKM